MAADAAIGALAGEAALYAGPEGALLVQAGAGAIQHGVDYCFESCGEPDFSAGALVTETLWGGITGAAFSYLDLGGAITDGLGGAVNDIGAEVENGAISDFMQRIGTSLESEGVVHGVTSWVADSVIESEFDEYVNPCEISPLTLICK